MPVHDNQGKLFHIATYQNLERYDWVKYFVLKIVWCKNYCGLGSLQWSTLREAVWLAVTITKFFKLFF